MKGDSVKSSPIYHDDAEAKHDCELTIITTDSQVKHVIKDSHLPGIR